MKLNDTHDPARRSWVESANYPGADFPIQNLPHGVFSVQGTARRGGIAIGDKIFDLRAALKEGLFSPDVAEIAELASAERLNSYVSRGNADASTLRAAVATLLCAAGPQKERVEALASRLLVTMSDATIHMPLRIGSFSDFMTSVHHVSAARRARPARPLNDNFLHLPVAYNSRATSITEDGLAFERPWGQRREEGDQVVFEPTAMLDFEVEFGAIIGPGNALGDQIALDDAEKHIFGYVLVNDWSARDIQMWESRLGPFLGKSFRSTISPWIVTTEALAPFAATPLPRGADQPQPLPYLDSDQHRASGALDVDLTAYLSTAKMRSAGLPANLIVDTKLIHCAWTLPQMVAHHTSNGCNLEPGDLISTGTVSGPEEEAAACLFERTAGVLPLELTAGERRVWLEDGDYFKICGRAERENFVGIGFGNCGAEILPARPRAKLTRNATSLTEGSVT